MTRRGYTNEPTMKKNLNHPGLSKMFFATGIKRNISDTQNAGAPNNVEWDYIMWNSRKLSSDFVALKQGYVLNGAWAHAMCFVISQIAKPRKANDQTTRGSSCPYSRWRTEDIPRQKGKWLLRKWKFPWPGTPTICAASCRQCRRVARLHLQQPHQHWWRAQHI